MKRLLLLIVLLSLCFITPSSAKFLIGSGAVGGGGGSYTETWGDGANDCDGACDYTSAVLEAYLYNNYSGRNYGASAGDSGQTYVSIGTANGVNSTYARGLLWFDIGDQHQAGTVSVTSASLYVYIEDMFGDPVTNPIKIYACLVDWGQNDSDNAASHECYEGDSDDAAPPGNASGNEPTWDEREAFSNTAWNTAGCDANAVGVDGDVAGDYDGANDRSNLLIIDAITTDLANNQYHELEFNAQGVSVIEYMMNNTTHNYGLIITIIDSEDADSWESFEYETKESVGGNSPYLEVSYDAS
jgi:hypothetical protein